jgi:hypothetical protein
MKWNEAKHLMMRTHSKALERVKEWSNDPNLVPPFPWRGGPNDLGFSSGVMSGEYFSTDDIVVVVYSLKPEFVIRCEPGPKNDNGPTHPDAMTLDQNGVFEQIIFDDKP